MADFAAVIPTILKHEGGFVNDPVDPGGATNYGVSLRFLIAAGDLDRDGVLDGDVDGDGDVDADDIRSMSVAKASKIYRLHFWDRHRYGSLVSQPVATKIFDTCVNMGPGRAHRIAQQAVNEIGYWNGSNIETVVVDGAIGPKTIAAINGCPTFVLLPALRKLQWEHYVAIMKANQKLEKFRNGWRNRAFS